MPSACYSSRISGSPRSRRSSTGSGVPDEQLPVALEEAECVLLAPAHPSPPGALARAQVPPTVMLILGVNGVGKTTTIAKLAWRLQREGRSVLASCA